MPSEAEWTDVGIRLLYDAGGPEALRKAINNSIAAALARQREEIVGRVKAMRNEWATYHNDNPSRNNTIYANAADTKADAANEIISAIEGEQI